MFGALIVLSVLGFFGGLLGIFGSMMSDAPVEANKTANASGIIVLISIAVIGFCLVARHNGWIS